MGTPRQVVHFNMGRIFVSIWLQPRAGQQQGSAKEFESTGKRVFQPFQAPQTGQEKVAAAGPAFGAR